jgi:hypothetical protein
VNAGLSDPEASDAEIQIEETVDEPSSAGLGQAEPSESDDPALAAFLNTAASGCGNSDTTASDTAPSQFSIDTFEPVEKAGAARKKLKRVSRKTDTRKDSADSSDWKNRRKRFS